MAQFTIMSGGPGKFVRIYEFWNYSSTVNPVNRVHGGSRTGDAVRLMVIQGRRGHKGFEARRCTHRSRASSHSEAWEPARGGRKERGEHGGPFAGLTGAQAAVWRSSNGDEVAAVKELIGRGAHARREGKKRRGRCGEKRRGSHPFIRVGGAPGRQQQVVIAGLMAFKPLMARVVKEGGGGVNPLL
jgi:hypothetical protein